MRKLKRKYQEGGFPQQPPQQMIPQEPGMQDQSMPSQGQQGMPSQGGPGIEEIVQQVQQAMEQGAQPAEIVIALLQANIDEQTIIQALQAVGLNEQQLMQTFEEVEQMISQQQGQQQGQQQMPPEGMPPEGMEQMPPEAMQGPPSEMQGAPPMMRRGGSPEMGQISYKNRFAPMPPASRGSNVFMRDALRRYIPKAQDGFSMPGYVKKTPEERFYDRFGYGDVNSAMSADPIVSPASPRRAAQFIPGMRDAQSGMDAYRMTNDPATMERSQTAYGNPEQEQAAPRGITIPDPFTIGLGAISLVNDSYTKRRARDYRNQMRGFGAADNVYQTIQNPLNRRGSFDVNTGLQEPDNYVNYLQSFRNGGEFEVDADTLAQLIASGAQIEML